MEKLTKTEITWTVSALELTINYYEQVARRSTNQRIGGFYHGKNHEGADRKVERATERRL